MMTWKEFVLGLAVVALSHGQGRWVGQRANNQDWYYMIDNGVDLIPKTWLVIALKACQGGEILFTEKHVVKKYVYVRLGDKSNGDEEHHTFANSHCASGSCTYGDITKQTVLDCNKYIPFWLRWDNQGKFEIGLGMVVGGTEPLLQMDYGEVFDLRLVKVSMTTTDTGTWLFNIDDAPLFYFPSPYVNSSVDVNEDVALGQEIASLNASDPDENPVTFTVIGDDADVFVCDGTSLKTKQALDYETKRSYYLTIEAKDERHSTVALLAVNIVNIIDETPSIVVSSNMLMSEELLKGTSLSGFFVTSDRDVNDTLTYSISGSFELASLLKLDKYCTTYFNQHTEYMGSGQTPSVRQCPDSGFFTINPDTGELVVAERVDRDGADGKKKLQIMLNVEDSGNLSTVSDIVITVVDVNDNPPLFSQPAYFTEVTEDSGDGLKILEMNCTDVDNDVNGDMVLSIVDGDDSDIHFYLSGQDLYVNSKTVDYESLEFRQFLYYLTVECTDSPQQGNTYTASAIVAVKILPDNEYTPVWKSPITDAAGLFPKMSLDEDVAPSTTLQTFSAADEDLGPDGMISYKIISVTANDGSSSIKSFSLGKADGILRTASNMDRDTATGGFEYFDIVIMAIDDGSSQKSVLGTLRVILNNVNDNLPQFDQSSYDVTIPENMSLGDIVTTIMTVDHDSDTVTLSVVGDWKDVFSISGDSVVLVKSLNYEDTRCLQTIIGATDGIHTANVTLSVKVTNVMDESPHITVYDPLTMLEEMPVGTVIGGVFTVSDDDDNDILTYSLKGADSQYFNINSSTGVLSIKQRIDADGTDGHSTLSQLTLVVHDSAGLSDKRDLIFTITDINDNTPQCSQDVYMMNVTENTAANELLLEFSCPDIDQGNNGDVKLSLDGGNHGNWFRIEGKSLYTDAVTLDYEETTHPIILTILAQDSPQTGLPRLDVAVVIVQILTVNEFEPKWTSPVTDASSIFPSVDVLEDAAVGFSIETYNAFDEDSGHDGAVTYSLASITSDKRKSYPSHFVIHPQLGHLTTNAVLDADEETGGVAFYDVIIVATDGGNSSKSVTGTVRISVSNVNDNPPMFVNYDSIKTVAENIAPGNDVHVFDVGDYDSNMVNLTLVGGDVDFFYVSGTRLLTAKKLDFEQQSFHLLVIQASDGVFKVNATFIVNVTDVVDEPPVIAVHADVSVMEEQPVGSSVCDIFHIIDRDKDDLFTYKLTGNHSSLLKIDDYSGILTVAGRIDRDGVSGTAFLDQLQLTVTDSAGLSDTVNLNITVNDANDNTPNCSSITYEANVTEGVNPTVILQMSCTDSDSGPNGELVLSISDGDDTDPKFSISGFHLTADATHIDYETLGEQEYKYTLTILAVDQPQSDSSKTGVTFVTVHVLPQNEFSPAWFSPIANSNDEFPDLSISEATLPGSNITQFTATDDDHGIDGVVKYEILSQVSAKGNSADVFTMDEDSGILRVASNLDVDSATGGVDYYNVTIQASDGGTPQLSATGLITIHLSNINDNPPVLTNHENVVEVAEDAVVGSVIHRITASDHDEDSVTVSVVGGDLDHFTGDADQIKIRKTLDYESRQCYIVVISMTDGKFSENVTLTVSVIDVNDETPFINVFNPLTIPEELPIGTVIGTAFHATDADHNDTLVYTLSGRDSGYFDINMTTGWLLVKKRIDLEGSSAVTSSLEITVTVQDQGGLTDTADLSFTVLDINDNVPTFSQSVYTLNVKESISVIDEILELVCTDGDSGVNGQFVLSVSQGNPDAIFTLSVIKLFVNGTGIDYESLEEEDYRYTLTIEAVDTPDQGPAKTGATLVLVQILPVNEFSPVWTSPAFDASSSSFVSKTIKEDTAVGVDIATFTAEDKDLGADGEIVYTIFSITNNNGDSSSHTFAMDSSTGNLRTASFLDSDIPTGGVTYYDVIVSATDSGSLVKSATGTIQIILENVNDNAPVLENFESSVDVMEDVQVGSVVFNLTAIDHDGDDVMCRVVGGDVSYFNSIGNDVKLAKVLDYEKQQCHTVIISVSDGKYVENVTLTLRVVDVNEPPVLHVFSSLMISEELMVGSVVGGVFYVTDSDQDDRHSYTLSGKDSGYFDMNMTTGLLSVKKRIDLEGSSAVTSSLEITVTVQDQGGLTDTADLSFTVLDINDNVPTFSQSVYTVNMTEATSIKDEILQLHCTDDDSGTNGEFTVSVKSGDDVFTTHGLSLFVDATRVDYESMSDKHYRFTLTILAVDSPQTPPARTGTTLVIVQVVALNEFTPVWMNPSFDTISERFPDEHVKEDASPGLNISTFIASDEDHGPDGDVTYRIVSTVDSRGKDRTGVFIMGVHTGTLRLSTTLDSDVATGGVQNYTVVVVAVDGGSEPRSVTGAVVIHVDDTNDNPPEVGNFHNSINVSEAAAVGDVVNSLNIVDYDDDVVAVSIVDGDVEFFTMDGNDIKLAKTLDYESAQCHSVVINLSDGKYNQNVTVTFYVTDVNDNSPVITVFSPILLPEEQPVGTAVCGISVADADSNDVLSFALSGSQASYFYINSTSGTLLINEVIDRDGIGGISIINDVILTATDTDRHSVNKTLIFHIEDVNDNPPVFSQWVYIVNTTEGKMVQDPLLTFDITDADRGHNSEVTLFISDGDDLDPVFNIQEKQLYLDGTKLDYESLKNKEYRYVLTITATDNPDIGAPRTSYAMVTVMILPENEFAPVWTSPDIDVGGSFSSVNISENITVGSTIATFTAADQDHGQDGIIEYHIMSIISDSGDENAGKFQIDVNSGILHSAGILDGDQATGGTAFYDVKISANDKGDPRKETTGLLRIYIDNVNDNEPQFQELVVSIDVAEDAAVGQSIYSVTAVDVDGDVIQYSVVGSDMLVFEGNDVKIARQLHYDTDRCMSFIISARDSDYEVNMTLIVNIVDVADDTPRLEAGVRWIWEEMPVGKVVCGLFSMTDADRNDRHTYSLEGSDMKYFNINTTSGMITIAERIDRDGTTGVTSITDLKLTVTDKSGLQDSMDLDLTIQDINDNAPVFSHVIYHANLTENTQPKSLMMTFSLTDVDAGGNGDFTLSIHDGDGQKSQFGIDGLDLVTGSRNVGYESREEQDYKFILQVIAVDNPESGSQRTGTAVVIVTILPLNEETPVWKLPTTDGNGRFPDVRIPEDIVAGSTVSTFEATDDDKGVDGIVTYHLVSVTTNAGSVVEKIFSLDLECGVLRTSVILDRDEDTGGVEFYDVVLQARDGNDSPRSVQGTLRIWLDNVNDNPPLLDCLYTVHIKESASVGVTVLSLTGYDADHDEVTFSMIDSDVLGMADWTSNVQIVKKLDFETQISHTTIISVTDGKHVVNSTLMLVVVDVNDEPPEITVTSISMMEELPRGTEVCGAFTVTDKDQGDILQFNIEGFNSDYFNMDSSSGYLTIAKSIDRDGQAGVAILDSIVVTVTDDVGHSSTATLNITITDINDNSPVCSYDIANITVTENSENKQYLTTIDCTDADSGSNGEVQVALSDGKGGVFYMVEMKLYVNGSGVDYEGLPGHVYMLVIEVTDLPRTGHVHTTTVLVSVNVLPVNEHEPEWWDPVTDDAGMFQDVRVNESLIPGVEIFKVSAVDADEGLDGDVHYNIQSAMSSSGEDSSSMFHMDGVTGSLCSVKALDADVDTGGVEFHTIVIEARDLGNSSRRVTGTVKILLQLTNDNPPIFSLPVYNVYVSCDVEPNTEMLKLTTHDVDGESDVLFNISSGSSDVINVEQSTGSVVLKTVPQFESSSDRMITIKVMVRDTDNKELSDEAHVILVFEDCSPSSVECKTQTPVQCVSVEPVTCTSDVDSIISDWVLRGLVMVFGVGLLAVLSVYMKTKLCPTNAVGDINSPTRPKAAWEDDTMERPQSCEKTLPMYDVLLEDEPAMFKVKR